MYVTDQDHRRAGQQGRVRLPLQPAPLESDARPHLCRLLPAVARPTSENRDGQRIFETAGSARSTRRRSAANGQGGGQARTLLTRKQLLNRDEGAAPIAGRPSRNDITAYPRRGEAQLRQLNPDPGPRADEADRANAAKSTFLALMSHEIRARR